MTGLWLAVLADTGATVLVTANALRLLRQGKSETATGLPFLVLPLPRERAGVSIRPHASLHP